MVVLMITKKYDYSKILYIIFGKSSSIKESFFEIKIVMC